MVFGLWTRLLEVIIQDLTIIVSTYQRVVHEGITMITAEACRVSFRTILLLLSIWIIAPDSGRVLLLEAFTPMKPLLLRTRPTTKTTSTAATTSTSTATASATYNRHIQPVFHHHRVRAATMNSMDQGDEISNSSQAFYNSSSAVYSVPELYDLAFGYRDFSEEVNFLLSQHKQHTNQPVHSLLEVAAGPARHALTALHDESNQVQSVYCVDSSPEMAQYAQNLAHNYLHQQGKESLLSQYHYHIQDMRHAYNHIHTPVDTAWILLGSLQHLTTNDDVIQCLVALHNAVNDNGTLFLELAHPRELFAIGECTRNGWTVPLNLEKNIVDTQTETNFIDNNDYRNRNSIYQNCIVDDPLAASTIDGQLEIIWGDEGDDFDPITEIRQFTIEMRVVVPQSERNISSERALLSNTTIRQVVPLRLFTAQEIDALARCAGWKVIAFHGALSDGVEIHDEEEAFRLVCVLQKRDKML